MTIKIQLDDFLVSGAFHFTGPENWIVVGDSFYEFIKGYLNLNPRKFLHSKYDVNHPQCGAYILQDWRSGKCYIGSSEDVYRRVARHKWFILKKRHDNSLFNELLKTREMKDFELTVIFTDDRESAYSLEQLLIDRYVLEGRLINIATDVRVAMRGRPLSEKHRQKIAVSNTGKSMSEEARQKIALSRKTSPAALAQTAEMLARKRRRVQVDGKEYESLTQAGQESAYSESYLRKHLEAEDNPAIYWLTNNGSPLKGRSLPDKQKQKLSEFRKTNELAQTQLASIRELTQKKIILNGTLYESIAEAVRVTGISESVIHRKLRLSGGKNIDGPYVLNYTKPDTKKQIVIEGIIYESIRSAARELGVDRNLLKAKLKRGEITRFS